LTVNIFNFTHLSDRLRCVQIVFNVHNQVKLKILTVNPFMFISQLTSSTSTYEQACMVSST